MGLEKEWTKFLEMQARSISVELAHVFADYHLNAAGSR